MKTIVPPTPGRVDVTSVDVTLGSDVGERAVPPTAGKAVRMPANGLLVRIDIVEQKTQHSRNSRSSECPSFRKSESPCRGSSFRMLTAPVRSLLPKKKLTLLLLTLMHAQMPSISSLRLYAGFRYLMCLC